MAVFDVHTSWTDSEINLLLCRSGVTRENTGTVDLEVDDSGRWLRQPTRAPLIQASYRSLQ